MYWDRSCGPGDGRIVKTPRVWTRRDEQWLDWQQGLRKGFCPARRVARLMNWLHRGSGLSRHDHLFRLAVDESRRDGTAASIVPKLEDARQMFEQLISAAKALDLNTIFVSLRQIWVIRSAS
jgi:hypothetical protein